MVSPIRVVLADDHPLILGGLENLLKMEEGFEVVSSCTNGEDALNAVKKYKPDILVLDLRMPRMDGLATLKAIRDLHLPVRAVFLAAELSEQDIIQGIRLGVNGVVLKEMAPRLLVQCLRKVSSGGQWLEREAFNRAMGKLIQRQEGLEEVGRALTNREVEIVRMVGQGFRNREIGEKLSISEGTVKLHLHNIFRKLNIGNRAQLVCYAHDKGLV